METSNEAMKQLSRTIMKRPLEEWWKNERIPLREFSQSLHACGLEMAAQILALGIPQLFPLSSKQLNFVQNIFTHGCLLFLNLAAQSRISTDEISSPENSIEFMAAQAIFLVNEVFSDIRKQKGYPLSSTEIDETMLNIEETIVDFPSHLFESTSSSQREESMSLFLQFLNTFCFQGELPDNIRILFSEDFHGLAYTDWSLDRLTDPVIYINSHITDKALLTKVLLEELIVLWELYTFHPIRRISKETNTPMPLDLSSLHLISPHRLFKKRQSIRKLAEVNTWPLFFDEVEALEPFLTETEKKSFIKNSNKEDSPSSSFKDLYSILTKRCGMAEKRVLQILSHVYTRPPLESLWEDNSIPFRSLVSAFMTPKGGLKKQILEKGYPFLMNEDFKHIRFVENNIKMAAREAWQHGSEEEGLTENKDLKQIYIENMCMIETSFEYLRRLKRLNALVKDASLEGSLFSLEASLASSWIPSQAAASVNAKKEDGKWISAQLEASTRDSLVYPLFDLFNQLCFNSAFPSLDIVWGDASMMELSEILFDQTRRESPSLRV
ncbi:hypothetical protein IE077_000143 [Cardiosporidium cionae]|uniref:Uncharacterized protein n=1 Tax=Cardiosporidium cionae TaxID=476202 RepID=A0ABQ7J5J4_9APIC|nr:hypothetical protein IE077_000143 [Cardiosporidium cionae]|eukprot:KAF8819233.1 hypothetical protein IE077_000143 [Cardiosporidium cionae]